MKKIKVSYMGKYLRDIYPHATKFQVMRFKFNKLMEKVLIVAFVIGAIVGAYRIGNMTTEATATYAKETVVVEIEKDSPVLERIAKCESGNRQFDSSGKLIVNINKDGSEDVGVFQINMKYWGLKAMKLGYNLTIEKDNREFGNYLYKNFGTEPWVWTKDCWNK